MVCASVVRRNAPAAVNWQVSRLPRGGPMGLPPICVLVAPDYLIAIDMQVRAGYTLRRNALKWTLLAA